MSRGQAGGRYSAGEGGGRCSPAAKERALIHPLPEKPTAESVATTALDCVLRSRARGHARCEGPTCLVSGAAREEGRAWVATSSRRESGLDEAQAA